MHVSALISRGRRWREERGFTMLLSLYVLTITTMLLGATYVALLTDTQLSRNDLEQKRAYAAAEAGIAAYTYQLNENVNYWELCQSASNVLVPGSTDNGSSEYYSTSPLIASTAPTTDQQCDTSNPVSTMIEGGTGLGSGTFRIKSTGYSMPTGAASCTKSTCVSRTLVVQYRRTSFLNFVYYTDYETLDPAALYNPANTPAEPTDCAAHYPNRGSDCSVPIDFVSGDVINGPLHSEDTLAICGSNGQGPVFGRPNAGGVVHDDTIQAAGVSTEGQNGCSLTYTINPSGNTLNTTSPSLTPPPTNAQLLLIALPAYQFVGRTTIVLNGSTMTVTNANISGGSETVPFPSNGVVYVSTASSGCPVNYTPFTANTAYTGDANCGNVYVSGNYSSSLTIASDNDIIINGNLTTAAPSTTLLGLVANDFVRVYHPVTNRTGTTSGQCGSSAVNGPGSLTNPTFDAAILAVNHSFIVDNYDCGASLGTLTIDGAVAQLFRGPVGTSGGFSSSTGYLKNYGYNDSLMSVEPPYFLNPVSAAWSVQRQTECDAAATC